MAAKNDYVRVRYVVPEGKSHISVESVLRFTQTICLGVIEALDMNDQGVPRSKHWLGDLPSDHPVADRPPSDPDKA